MQDANAFILIAILALAGCAVGGMQSYQDYPWGSYSWESDHNHHTDPGQAWSDYNRYFGKDLATAGKPDGG